MATARARAWPRPNVDAKGVSCACIARASCEGHNHLCRVQKTRALSNSYAACRHRALAACGRVIASCLGIRCTSACMRDRCRPQKFRNTPFPSVCFTALFFQRTVKKTLKTQFFFFFTMLAVVVMPTASALGLHILYLSALLLLCKTLLSHPHDTLM